MLTSWRVSSVFSKLALVLIFLPRFLAAQIPSAVSLFGSPNPSVFGGPVTLTAVMTPSSATGRVTFYDGTMVLGVSTIAAGQASLTTNLLSSGTRILRAHYSGDANYN